MAKWMEGMNAEAMDKWMADLRSGEFTQGQGLLHRVDGEMCCLGVATDTNYKVCGLSRQTSGDGDRYQYADDRNRIMGALMPVGVMSYLGIPEKFRDVGAYDGAFFVFADKDSEAEMVIAHRHGTIDGRAVISVISLNDSMELTFSKIADRIEATFKVEEE